MTNIKSEFYNDKIREIEEMAEMTSCADIMNKYIDQYSILTAVMNLGHTIDATESSVKAAKALVASTEVTIFKITGAIIKGIYNIAKFFLRLLGKLVKFIFHFFKRSIKDTSKKLEEISQYIKLIQSSHIPVGVNIHELHRLFSIVDEHCNCDGMSPELEGEGTSIANYKKLYYNKFNTTVKPYAQVQPDTGALKKTPALSTGGSTVAALGWTSYEVLSNSLNELESTQKRIAEVVKELKGRGRDIKRVVNECEARSFVANKFIEYKSREVLDSSCFIIVIFRDIKTLKVAENNFGNMVDHMAKCSKKQVAA